jgi:hypothetical protein
MSVLSSVENIDKHFEDKLMLVASGMGGLVKKLMADVGKQMAADSRRRAQSAFHSRTGRLLNAIKFIATDTGGVFTTKTSINEPANKAKTFYASFIERGANIKPKRKKYLKFKINGEWKTVSSAVIRPRPFMKPVFDEYFGNETSKGYRLLADALNKTIDKDLGK